jgi:hypothetical protein
MNYLHKIKTINLGFIQLAEPAISGVIHNHLSAAHLEQGGEMVVGNSANNIFFKCSIT